MDKIDQKIMKELDENPKIVLTKLAKKARVSQQSVDYRIKRLLKNKEITKFGTIINLKALGQEHYRIFFTFNKHEVSDEKMFSYLKNQKGVYWAARVGGRYDLHITLFVFDFQELDNFIDNFNQEFPGLVKDYKSCYALEHSIYRHKHITKNPDPIVYGYNDKIQKIDSLDKYILNKIKDNCRISALELSKGKNVSYKTIINRIKSLELKKIILGYRIFIRSVEKKPFIVLISFQNYSKDEENKILDYLKFHPETTQTLRLFGIWQLYIHSRSENLEKLQQLIIELRDKFSIIDNFEIIPVFEDISINLFPID